MAVLVGATRWLYLYYKCHMPETPETAASRNGPRGHRSGPRPGVTEVGRPSRVIAPHRPRPPPRLEPSNTMSSNTAHNTCGGCRLPHPKSDCLHRRPARATPGNLERVRKRPQCPLIRLCALLGYGCILPLTSTTGCRSFPGNIFNCVPFLVKCQRFSTPRLGPVWPLYPPFGFS